MSLVTGLSRFQDIVVMSFRRPPEGHAMSAEPIELGRAKSDYLQAKAHEDLSRQNYEREEGLFAERISSEKEMLVAKAAHLEAVARLRNSEETLRLYGLDKQQIETLSYDEGKTSLLPVRSPLSGRVVEKHVTVGELITPERNAFTVADLGHVWIWIDVYEQDLRNVHLEDDVSVAVDAYSGELFGGQVSYLSDQVDGARFLVDGPQTEADYIDILLLHCMTDPEWPSKWYRNSS